ncbi:PREDICTED: zinc finger protein 277 [Rhagoletis zephyria]|uniref:zinc finger protein 277 n=1 Tax=Rhagoletis zephyria TaxID=28612 RepID=UPI000811916A|nr:PREDICTED: zinc finger protein 277 [Rhagoletis zephyria]
MDEKHLENEVLPALTFNQKSAQPPAATPESLQIQCLKCDCVYQFPTAKDDYLAHLFMEHRLVIADVEDVALLDEYLKCWQKDLQGHELEEYCTTMLLDQLPDGTPAKNERYYLLSDILPKDYELRFKLQQQRLEHALAQHQFERTDRDFTKECLYCRDVITGLRSDFLEHLFNKHFLQLGKPENLVYIDELLSKVQHNLENLVCLYCEKIFKDRSTLKEHMRKKAHKRINPNNSDYDRFFLLNYRNEKQKPQQHSKQHNVKKRVHKESTHQEVAAAEVRSPELATSPEADFERRFALRSQSNESDSDWSDWDDDIGKMYPLNCLYCKEQKESFDGLKEHMLTAHGVNFAAVLQGLNFYQRIKVVNYVRRQICFQRCVSCNLRCENQDTLLEHMVSEQHFGCGTKKQWDKPEYFFPTYEDDTLLCVLDDSPNDDMEEGTVRIISEDTMAQINKDAERLSLENFQYL